MKRIVMIIILCISLIACSQDKDVAPKVTTPDNNLKTLPPPPLPETPVLGESAVTQVDITANGFVPKVLTVKAGQRVAFVNKGDKAAWPASDFHPTHEQYPGSSITKCGTVDEVKIFDACKDVPPSGSYSFMFNEKGRFGAHNHRTPSDTMTIVVE